MITHDYSYVFKNLNVIYHYLNYSICYDSGIMILLFNLCYIKYVMIEFRWHHGYQLPSGGYTNLGLRFFLFEYYFLIIIFIMILFFNSCDIKYVFIDFRRHHGYQEPSGYIEYSFRCAIRFLIWILFPD